MSERTYNEKEVAKLIERAAELQKQSPYGGHANGLTLDELAHVAEEAGIDPHHLRQAAAEFDGGKNRASIPGTSTTTHIITSREIDVPFTDDVWEDIVMELRHRYDSDAGAAMGMPQYGKGTTEKIGSTHEWKHTNMSGIVTRVMAKPTKRGFSLKVSKRVGWGKVLSEAIVYGFALSTIAAAIGGGADGGFGAIIGGLLGMLIFIPIIYWISSTYRKGKHNELEQLANDIAAMCQRSATKSSAERTPSATEEVAEEWSRIDLDAALPDDVEEPPDEAAVRRNRNRNMG